MSFCKLVCSTVTVHINGRVREGVIGGCFGRVEFSTTFRERVMIAVDVRLCSTCGVEIPSERLEVLPNTETCVGCSTVKKVIGFQVFDHKTGGSPVLIDPDDKETLRQARRANRRAR
jgi:hypothetical protein